MIEGENSQTQTSVLLQHNRFRKILKRRLSKTLQEIFFRYFNYIFSTAPSAKLVISIFRVFFMMQIMAAVIQVTNKEFYGTETTMSKIFVIVSTLTQVNIPTLDPDVYSYVALVVSLLALFTFIYIFASMYYFHVQSKLSHIQVSIISTFVICSIPYMMNVEVTYFSSEIDSIHKNGVTPIRVINIVISIITYAVFFVLHSIFVPANINFRATVHGIFFIRELQVFIAATSFSILFSQIGANLGNVAAQIVAIAALIGDILAFYITTRNHVWLSDTLKRFFQGMFIVNIFYRILIPVLKIAGAKSNESIVVSYLILIIIVAVVGSAIEKHYVLKEMLMLEQYTGMDFFEQYSHKKILSMTKIGFFHGFQQLHNWNFITDAFVHYPNDRSITLLYARFSAIYPDEIDRVRDSIIRLIAIKKNDMECKKLLHDLQSLLQLRERNLTKGLKKQLKKTKDRSDRCIAQARRIWECVIRGSTAEINLLSIQLQNLSKQVQKEYSQLLLIYPNNPFVARAYSQFLESVVCDAKLSNEYYKIYQSLKVGKQLHVEKGYFFAISEIPTLPIDKDHAFYNQEKQTNIIGVKSGIMSNPSMMFNSGMMSTGELHGDLGVNSREISQEHQYVEHAIQSIKLPSTVIIKALLFFMFFVVLLVATIPYLIIIPKRISTNIQSAISLRYIAEMYVNILQTMTDVIQYVGSENGLFPSIKNQYKLIAGEDGYPYTDKDVLFKTLASLRYYTQKYELMLPMMKDTGFYNTTLHYSFNLTGPIRIYFTARDTTPHAQGMFSMQSYILYVIKIGTDILTDPKNDTWFDGSFATLSFGIVSVKDFWDKIMDSAVAETDALFTFRIETEQIMLIFDLIVMVILEIGIIIYEIMLVQNEKTMVSNAFKAIPKRSITQIIQNLNQYLNRNIENDDEQKLDRQEENALRILSTANTQSTVDFKLIGYLITPQLIYIAASFIIFYIFYVTPINISTTMRNISPQLYNLIKAPTALQSVIMTALRYNLKAYPAYNDTHSDTVDFVNTKQWLEEQCINAFPQYIKEWWQGEGDKGAHTAGDKFVELYSNSSCHEYTFLAGAVGTLTCTSIETSAYAVIETLQDLLAAAPHQNDYRLGTAILWSQLKLMDTVVEPGFDIIQAEMEKENDDLRNQMTIPIIIIILILAIIGLFAMVGIDIIAESTLGTIKLFLLADPKDVINSKTILKILSNDFSTNDDENSKDSSFYEQLVSNLPDGCVFMNNSLKIISSNAAVENILGISPNDTIGKQFEEIVHAPEERDTSLKTFIAALNTSMNNMRSPRITMEAEVKRGNDTINVEFNVIAVSLVGEVQISSINREGLAMVIIVMRDTTQAQAAKRLLDEEHHKGENLLKMILPDRIVKQLQRGDSNISFAVPSASILFMDIVSFTPWCGSLDAKTVMSTLNKMFKMFDTSLSRQDKMIKIKCIGDCYMAAGGIFDEVNNPALHAKQAISFCLDAINGLSLFNIENKMQLRIRAGINCGGPIIAGVLGIEKPTFDILGSAISVAAAMEHHGVPMNVHIPQHMYDLVYDQEFVFKERGEVNIKDKMIKTYLVSGYTTHHD